MDAGGTSRTRRRTALVLDKGAALPTVRSLGRGGWRVLTPAGTRLCRSRYSAGAVVLDSSSPRAWADSVALACERHGVDVVVPCDDHSLEMLWANATALGHTKILGAGDEHSLQLSVDKQASAAAADRVGFPTPVWFAPVTHAEAEQAVALLGVPCVVKPRLSFTSHNGAPVRRGHRFLERQADLEGLLDRLGQADGTLPILQEFVPGRSLAVSAVVHDGAVLAYIAREALSHFPVGGGTPVHKRTIAPSDRGVQQALAFLIEIGYSGLVNVEYQVGSNGTPRLMELSGRIHISIPLAMAAGVDLPLIAAEALLGAEPGRQAQPGEYRVGVEMRWPKGEAGRLAAVVDPRAEGFWQPFPGLSRRSALARAWPLWRPGMRYDNWDPDDVAPWVPRLRALGLSRLRGREGCRAIVDR